MFIITGLMTFLDTDLLDKIGILDFKNKFHLWIGISLVTCIAGLIVIYCEKTYNYIYNKKHSIKKQVIQAIKGLNRDESSDLISYFYSKSEKCFLMESNIPTNNGIAAVLRTKKIIILASKQVVFDDDYTPCAVHVLQNDAFEFLNSCLINGSIEIQDRRYWWFSKKD